MRLLKLGKTVIKLGSAVISLKEATYIDPNNYKLLKTNDYTLTVSTDYGPAFYFSPKNTIEVGEIEIYSGRVYTASNSNKNGEIGICYIEEYDSNGSYVDTILRYSECSIYGSSSSSKSNPMWFSDPNGGGRGDKGNNASNGKGLHKIYPLESIEIEGFELHKYKFKRTDGNKFVFRKGYKYRLGCCVGFHNSLEKDVYTLCLDYESNSNNCLVKNKNDSSSVSNFYPNSGLPYMIFDGKVFVDFEMNEIVNPEEDQTEDVIFTNGKFSITNYNTLEDVKNSIQDGDILSIFVRHAERGSATGKNGGLVSNGIEQCKRVGTLLSDFTQQNDIFGESTDVLRTCETVYWIYQERGDDKYTQPIYNSSTNEITTNIPKTNVFSGSVYLGESNWDVVSNFCMDETNREHIRKVSQKIIKHILEMGINKLNVFCSHDSVLVPMISYVTDYNLIPTSASWCNYLNGVAIIKRSNGSIEIAPLNALIN